jgi:hypothetical protein
LFNYILDDDPCVVRNANNKLQFCPFHKISFFLVEWKGFTSHYVYNWTNYFSFENSLASHHKLRKKILCLEEFTFSLRKFNFEFGHYCNCNEHKVIHEIMICDTSIFDLIWNIWKIYSKWIPNIISNIMLNSWTKK